nr:hypothetical protein [Slackia faecicanis]
MEGFGGAAQPSMTFMLVLSLLLTKGEASVGVGPLANGPNAAAIALGRFARFGEHLLGFGPQGNVAPRLLAHFSLTTLRVLRHRRHVGGAFGEAVCTSITRGTSPPRRPSLAQAREPLALRRPAGQNNASCILADTRRGLALSRKAQTIPSMAQNELLYFFAGRLRPKHDARNEKPPVVDTLNDALPKSTVMKNGQGARHADFPHGNPPFM